MKSEVGIRNSGGNINKEDDRHEVQNTEEISHHDQNLHGSADTTREECEESSSPSTVSKSNPKLRKISPKKKKSRYNPTDGTGEGEQNPLGENRGVVIGNFHAQESDDQSEVLLPRLVNGCSRVIIPNYEQQIKDENYNKSDDKNDHRNYSRDYSRRRLEYMKDTRCGVGGTCGGCQSFATRWWFLVIFCLTTVLQGMFYTYFVSGLSTIQKLYRISSQVTGIIMSATEVGQIGGSLFLAYYGGSGHRPRWIAWGMVLFSICTFMCAMPHFLFSYSTQTDLRSEAIISGDDEATDHFNTCNSMEAIILSNVSVTNSMDSALHTPCQNPSRLTNFILGFFFLALIGVGIGQTAVVNLGIPYIDDNVDNKDSPMYFATTSAVRILGPTLGFVLGSLCTRLYVYPFQTPDYPPSDPRWVGAWWLGHIIVSALLMMASWVMFLFPRQLPLQHHDLLHLQQQRTLRSHHSASTIPMVEASTHAFSASTTATSILTTTAESPPPDGKVRTNLSALLYAADSVGSSARSSATNLATGAENAATDGAAGPMDPMLDHTTGHMLGQDYEDWDQYREKPRLKDFPRAVGRQLRNRVLVLRTASSVLHILPIAGLYTFLPKYLETQFRLPVHTAAMLSGTGGILLMGVGIFSSGVYIRYTRPSARAISAWIAFTALLYCIGMVILMFIGCGQDDFVDLVKNSDSYSFTPPCNRSCAGSCDDSVYAPVCSSTGNTHFSACHLGCSSVSSNSTTSTVQFSNCECLDDMDSTAELRVCELKCDAITWYITIFAVFVIIHSTAEVGGMLITLRCCQKHDKAMALGLISLAIGLFGNMPCPILYGGIVDGACIQWRITCGKVGDCQLYDTTFFRLVFHGITAGVMLFAFFVDVAVFMKSKNIVLDPDNVVAEPCYRYAAAGDVLSISSSSPMQRPRDVGNGASAIVVNTVSSPQEISSDSSQKSAAHPVPSSKKLLSSTPRNEASPTETRVASLPEQKPSTSPKKLSQISPSSSPQKMSSPKQKCSVPNASKSPAANSTALASPGSSGSSPVNDSKRNVAVDSQGNISTAGNKSSPAHIDDTPTGSINNRTDGNNSSAGSNTIIAANSGDGTDDQANNSVPQNTATPAVLYKSTAL